LPFMSDISMSTIVCPIRYNYVETLNSYVYNPTLLDLNRLMSNGNNKEEKKRSSHNQFDVEASFNAPRFATRYNAEMYGIETYGGNIV